MVWTNKNTATAATAWNIENSMVAEHEKIKEIRPYPQERKTNFLNGYFPKEFFLFDSFSSLIWHGWKREREAKKSVIIFKEGDSAMTPQMMVFSTKL